MIYFSNYKHPEIAITTISNTASLTANKFIGALAPVTFNATNIKLSINNTPSKSEYFNGQEIIYTIIVANDINSDENATNLQIEDIMPIQIKDVTASSNIGNPNVIGNNTDGYIISFYLDTLNKGQTLILTIKGSLNLN